MSKVKVRMGILGGSFDPIHFGHIKPSIELAEKFQLSSIKLIPCKISPFKDTTFASAEHRWNMISIIAGSSDLFIADNRELQRNTPSYSYETLREIAQELASTAKLFWIMGEDALQGFPKWYEAEKIMQLCHVLVMRRPGNDTAVDETAQQWLNQYLCHDSEQLENTDCGHIYITDTEMHDISSTQIREIVQSGQQPRYLLPGGVWNYIKRNELYQSTI